VTGLQSAKRVTQLGNLGIAVCCFMGEIIFHRTTLDVVVEPTRNDECEKQDRLDDHLSALKDAGQDHEVADTSVNPIQLLT